MNLKYNFSQDSRYLTRGVSEQIPIEIQLFMWNEISQIVAVQKQVDYLQVFEFRVKDNMLEVEHRTEEPEYKKLHQLKCRDEYKSLNLVKVFVIDVLITQPCS